MTSQPASRIVAGKDGETRIRMNLSEDDLSRLAEAIFEMYDAFGSPEESADPHTKRLYERILTSQRILEQARRSAS